MKEQKKKIMAILAQRLGEYGYEKKGYDCFVRIIDNNIIQNIGFGCATYGEKYVRYLNPSIGVVYRDVNKMEMQLRNLGPSKYPDYVGSMICKPVGYLMPENTYLEWKFTRDEDVTVEANKMADAIIKYGIPYHEELSNRDNVIYGLEIGKYTGSREFMLPIFHYLNGNNKRALECIDEFIQKFSSYPSQEEYDILKKLAGDNGEVHFVNNGLKSYLEFVDNFKQMLSQEGSL